MHLFSFRKRFCDLFLLFCFFCNLLGTVTEKRRGRVGRGEDAWCVQYDSTEHFCSQRTKNCQMLPSEIVNPNIKLLYLGCLGPQAKPQPSAKHMSFMRLCTQAYKSIDPNTVVSN